METSNKKFVIGFIIILLIILIGAFFFSKKTPEYIAPVEDEYVRPEPDKQKLILPTPCYNENDIEVSCKG